MREAVFAFAHAVLEVFDGLFHAERHVIEAFEVLRQIASEALLLCAACFELGFAWGSARGGADAIDVCAHVAGALLVFGHGVLRVLCAHVVADPKRPVARGFKLAQGIVAQRLAVSAQRDGSVCGEEWPEACECIDVDEPLLGMACLGARGGEVERDGIELAGGKNACE